MALCGWASIDERGKGRGGKVGDQTGREVKTGQWYNFGQKYVIRYKDAKMAKKHAEALKKLCNGNLVGYDMDNRGSLYSELKKVRFIVDDLKVKCETDCSALQCTMAICAGAKNIQLWASGSMKDGFDGKCKQCKSNYYANNREKRLGYQNNYAHENGIAINYKDSGYSNTKYSNTKK